MPAPLIRTEPVRVPLCAEITLGGTLATSSSMPLHEAIEAAIHGGARALILAMKDVQQISSSPLSILVAASEQLRPLGGVVYLVGVAQKVRVVIDALNLQSAFVSTSSLDDARKAGAERIAVLAKAPKLSQDGKLVPILDEPVVIGSDAKCTIVVPHPQVEGRHAVVTARGAEVRVRDLGSRYGTFIDGKRIKDEQPLAPGAALTIANAKFVVKAPGK
jgi:anti-anti-sigma factor